ncbi:uncharacterized protein ARB_05536 [Trichophyton benhamiae CBS 112371]|uniref:uncharacterized protein n=1 Tax=Arthroderma benhamiae (strain ATCC MYA-4681 / CBS 112371) TaxID=663331 RepID=UPI0001CB5105|nr:uncharacterized protein ARB_05536 [Trichophyton benhamiae CBS 112371]EFE35494.1 hypothetical protein ARB_05536 [Trichophyton benhamiae CBS 112371]
MTYLIQPEGKHLAGESVKITITFLSPITPTSTLRQSIPAGYVTIRVEGNMNVNIYMDMNGEWVTGDRGSSLIWKMDNIVDTGKGESLYQWQVSRKTEQLFTEFQDRAEWGMLHFLAPQVESPSNYLEICILTI